MKKNLHPLERELRILLGITLCALALFGPKNPWFWLGLIPLVTGLIGWCPPYALLGLSTCKNQKLNDTKK